MDNISPKLSDDDLNKVNEFSRQFYEKIINRHPEWDKYAMVESYGGESFVTIKIPPPIEGVFSVEIMPVADYDDELTIYFGPAHFHMGIYLRRGQKTLFDQLNGIEKIAYQIFNEKLVAVKEKPGHLGFVAEGLLPPEDYNELLEKGKLRRAISWKGTYNYPKDGTHANWGP
jgi:hypothetical protein